MKISKTLIWSFLMLVIVAALYRIIPGRPFGFAPQWAMAVFAGAVVPSKKWAFLMPVLSLFVSDLLYQGLFLAGASDIPGFYEGQWQNYLLFSLLVVIGFIARQPNALNVFAASLAAPTVYFLLSNLIVWAGWQGTRGYARPKTFDGLMLCYTDGLPFYRTSLLATVLFSAVLFGAHYLMTKNAKAASGRGPLTLES